MTTNLATGAGIVLALALVVLAVGVAAFAVKLLHPDTIAQIAAGELRRGTLDQEDLVQYPDYGFVIDLTAAAIPIGAGSASVYEFEGGLATRIVADIQATFDGATNLTGLVLALEVSADAPTVVGRRWAPVRLVNAATDVTLATIVPGGGASQAVYVYASNARGALYCRLLAYGAGVAGAAADHLRVRLGVG